MDFPIIKCLACSQIAFKISKRLQRANLSLCFFFGVKKYVKWIYVISFRLFSSLMKLSFLYTLPIQDPTSHSDNSVYLPFFTNGSRERKQLAGILRNGDAGECRDGDCAILRTAVSKRRERKEGKLIYEIFLNKLFGCCCCCLQNIIINDS